MNWRAKRKKLEREAREAWNELHDALVEGKLPSVAWALRWSPDGTLRVLWRATSDYFCHSIAYELGDPADPTSRIGRYMEHGSGHVGGWVRRNTPAPTLEEIRAKFEKFVSIWDIPF